MEFRNTFTVLAPTFWTSIKTHYSFKVPIQSATLSLNIGLTENPLKEGTVCTRPIKTRVDGNGVDGPKTTEIFGEKETDPRRENI